MPRVYALVELLRADAAFMTGPVVLPIAMTVSGGPKGGGIETAIWICFGIAAAGGLIPIYVWLLGRAKLQAPHPETFLQGDEPAWRSPPLAPGIRASPRSTAGEVPGRTAGLESR